MRTIEKIKERKTFYKRHRDSFGNLIKEPYQKAVSRKVKLVVGWQRFGHYLIDSIIIAFIVYFGNHFLFEEIEITLFLGFELNGVGYNFLPNLVSMVFTVSYYVFNEKTLQRTIGKFVTNSIVINEYGENPSNKALVIRSFSRLVPFEIFSCLSERGWHDRWSKTYVVTIHESNLLKRLLSEQDGFYVSENQEFLD